MTLTKDSVLDSVHSASLRTCVIMGWKNWRESLLNGGRVRGDLARHCRRSGSSNYRFPASCARVPAEEATVVAGGEGDSFFLKL